MTQAWPRVIPLENIKNFRDLGGYRAGKSKTTLWRHLYRSGDPIEMSAQDKAVLKADVGLKTVIDLTTPDDVKKLRENRILEEIGVKYFNLPFRPNVIDYYRKELTLYQKTLNLGYFYLERLKHESFPRQLFAALEIIAGPQYHPVLFHCGAGKDRTGVLAAMILDLLNVSDTDIVADYCFTDTSMAGIRDRIVSNPATTEEVKSLPDFHWRATADYMITFLDGLRKEYGGAAGYLKIHGADKTLARRLKKALVG